MHNEYREADLRIFPLWPMKNGRCTCGNAQCPEEAAGKHPRASNWQHTPSWSDEQIENFEEFGWFETGFGVLCNNLLVIDVDERNGGGDSLEILIEDFPEIAGCGFVVRTGSGGKSRHYYFKAPASVSLMSKLQKYVGIDFKSSGYVVGAGSNHRSGNNYEAVIGQPTDIDDAPKALIEALKKPERHRATFNGTSVDVSHSDIAEMLAHIDPSSDYETWIRCGMAVHHATAGTGYSVWNDWSASSEKYDEGRMPSHWQSFGKTANPVTLGTLAHHAEQGGWIQPVTFGGEAPKFEFPEEDTGNDTPIAAGAAGGAHITPLRGTLPLDITGVDLSRPTGFVGDVAQWVEAQSRRPRLIISVATALHTLGNVFGLRYTDDKDGVTTNLFTFCVAGSRTGKESIQQAAHKIHDAAHLSAACHGAIKSEQEITRNLTRHQAALYVVDEIGILLQKIQNAQKKGGAVYLDGVIGLLMSAYSKADGFLPLSGDAKEEQRTMLEKQLAQVQRRIEENAAQPFDDAKATALLRSLSTIDKGLDRPLLSLMGFTTNVTFDDLVDLHSATNGFIGRALIFNERDTAPRSKKGMRRTPMSDAMAATIGQLSDAGHIEEEKHRVEFYGDRIEIPTDEAASSALDDVLDWFEDQAIDHKAKSGLEALWLGAYELVSKVSLILAIPEGLRTVEHVRWAFALIRRDVTDKISLVTANDRQKDSPAVSLAMRILSLCGGDDGETAGVIRNRLRKSNRPADIDGAIKQLLEGGKIEAILPQKAQRGPKSPRYRSLS